MLIDLQQDQDSWHNCNTPQCTNEAIGAFRVRMLMSIDDNRSLLDLNVKLCRECISKMHSNMNAFLENKK